MDTRFKATKIGRIPEEWEIQPLGDLGDFFKGTSIKASEIVENGLPCIRYGDIYVQYENDNVVTHFSAFISRETAEHSRRIYAGDILFAGTGETQEDIGKCVAYTIDREAYAGGDLIVFRPKKEYQLNSVFLSYCMNCGEVAKSKSRLGQGLSIFHIYSINLKTLHVPLPPLPEQRKIAEILSTVDETIEKTDAIIQETQQLKKGLIQKLFTEGIGHTRFKETKIGRIPEGWDYDILGNVAKVKGGKRLPKGDQFAGTRTPYPYIRIVDFRNMSVAMGGLKYLKNKTQKSIARYTISSSDVYISIAGTIGLVGIVPDELDGAKLTENAAKICNLKKVNKVFLAYFLISPNAQKQIDSFIGISTQPKLALNRIEKIQLPIPELDEQCEIAEILSEVDSKTEREQAFKEELEKLKKGLMQVLLTGKVRVKV